MSGIIFYKTRDLNKIRNFYETELNMDIWLNQGKCIILKKGNLQLGFCESEKTESAGTITFYYDSKTKVDKLYNQLKDIAIMKPEVNKEFNIYQFFARDPEGRTLEFQYFLHQLKPYLSGEELLLKRRSVRKYKDKNVSRQLLLQVFDNCRFAPTSCNSQSFYYLPVREKEKIKKLASIREPASSPIGRAPLAVAVCCDKDKTKRPYQDGDIAAYHFILAAKLYGLGTCWIADMDRKQVKEIIEIPEKDYVATVTPVGYPDRDNPSPERKEVTKFVKNIT